MTTKVSENIEQDDEESQQADPPEVVNPPLTPQQEQAAHILAYCGYVKGRFTRAGGVRLAAHQVGVTRQAIYKWLKLPEFVEEIQSQKAKGFYAAWQGLMIGAAAGNASSCSEILNRLQRSEDPKVKLAKLKHRMIIKQKKLEHRLRLIEMERRAKLGLPAEEEETLYRVTIGEYGDDVPEPEAQH